MALQMVDALYSSFLGFVSMLFVCDGVLGGRVSGFRNLNNSSPPYNQGILKYLAGRLNRVLYRMIGRC